MKRGRSYLDFMSGIGVYALGYHFPGYDEALIEQIRKILAYIESILPRPLAEAAKKLVPVRGTVESILYQQRSGGHRGRAEGRQKVFLDEIRTGRHEIIAMKESFHGRTVGALSLTGNEHYQEPFRPLMDGVLFAEFNDLRSVEKLLSDRSCAVIVETVQGEGGVFPADPEFLTGLRRLCDERDLVLILDEVQCGMGRTGTMWAFEQYGVKPDILCSAKALGCGVPVGAFVLNEKLAENSLVPGDHGTTYGGNPFVTAAVSAVFDIFKEHGIPELAAENGRYLAEKLDGLAGKYPCIRAHRGLGLIRGLELDESVSAGAVATAALNKGLFIITAGHNVLRFLPPLIISKEEIDEGIAILDECLDELS